MKSHNPFAAEYAAKINELTQTYIEQVEELYRQYQQNHQSLKTAAEDQEGDSDNSLTSSITAPPDSLSQKSTD